MQYSHPKLENMIQSISQIGPNSTTFLIINHLSTNVTAVNIAKVQKTTCDMYARAWKKCQWKQVLPFTCLTHRSAYLSVLMVLDLPLFLFSDGKCIFRSFRVLKTSFCVFALADCSLLQGVHETDTRASKRWQGLTSAITVWEAWLSSMQSRTGGR